MFWPRSLYYWQSSPNCFSGEIHKGHAVGYALGGIACGLVGLFLVGVNGIEYPTRAAVVYGGCAAGLLASNLRWQRRVIAHGGLWLVLVGSLWLLHAVYPKTYTLWGLLLALEALAFAGLSLGLNFFADRWLVLLQRASRDLSLATGILVCAIVVFSSERVASSLHTGTLFTLAITCLALTRLFASPISTYFASGFALLGFLHLNTLVLGWYPTSRAVLVALLAHATLDVSAAFLLRKYIRLFSLPLWRSSLVSTGFAALPLLFPPSVLALEWAGCAVWIGLVWLAYSLFWRQPAAFTLFQIALCWAAILCGVDQVQMRNWQAESRFGLFDPVALHVYSSAIGLLGSAWVIARRAWRNNPLIRKLWLEQAWSAERVTLAGMVVFQFLLAVYSIVPEVSAELIPLNAGYVRLNQTDFVRTFGPAAWMSLGILTVTLLVSWRLVETEKSTPSVSHSSSQDENVSVVDSHIYGMWLLFLTVPLIWAGMFASETASASALRWALGVAFVIGSALLAARTQLRRSLEKIGFQFTPSLLMQQTSLILLGCAAGIVVLISMHVAQVGLVGQKLSGPAVESLFTSMGPLLSNLVPLALVVLGLTGTAARERSAGYAFAGGIVFSITVAAGYALGVVTAGGQIDSSQQIRIWLLLCGAVSVWAIAWLAAETRVPGGVLLAVQSRLGFAGLIIIASTALISLLNLPEKQLAAAWNLFGIYGWVTLGLAAGAAGWQSMRTEPVLKFHTITLTSVIAGVLAACAVQPWDLEGKWLSFHVLSGAWTVVGIGLIVAARRTGVSSLWLDGIALALTIMAIRGGWSDPARPWVPAGLSVVASVILGTAGIFGRSQPRVYISVLLASVVSILLWLPSESNTHSGFLLMNAAGLAMAAAVWSLIAIRETEAGWHSVTDLARGIALVFLGFGLAPTMGGDRIDPQWLTWCSTSAVALAFGAALWDVKAMISREGLFAAGIAAVLLGVSETTDNSEWNIWQTPIALAGYCLLEAGLAVLVTKTRKGQFNLPERGDSWGWLLTAQAIVGAMVLVLSVRTGLLAPKLAERLSSPGSILLLVGAAILLLRSIPLWAETLRHATVGLGVLVFATAAWSWPDPAGSAPWLLRNAWLFVALAASGILASETGVRVISANCRIPNPIGGRNLSCRFDIGFVGEPNSADSDV